LCSIKGNVINHNEKLEIYSSKLKNIKNFVEDVVVVSNSVNTSDHIGNQSTIVPFINMDNTESNLYIEENSTENIQNTTINTTTNDVLVVKQKNFLNCARTSCSGEIINNIFLSNTKHINEIDENFCLLDTKHIVDNKNKNTLTLLNQPPKVEMCLINNSVDVDIKLKIKNLLSKKFLNHDPYKNFVDLCNQTKELIDDQYDHKIAYGILDTSQKITIYHKSINSKIQLNFSKEKQNYLKSLKNKEINNITNNLYKNSINCLKILYYLDFGLNYNYYYLLIETIPMLITHQFSTLDVIVCTFLKIVKFVVEGNS